MNIKEELSGIYQQYKDQHLDNEIIMKIELHFMECISKALTQAGNDKTSIERSFSKLSMNFHPDTLLRSSNESILWFEKTFASVKTPGEFNIANAICFKLLQECKDSLINHETLNFDTDAQEGTEVIATLRNYCFQEGIRTSSFCKKALYIHMVWYLDDLADYTKKTSKLNSNAMKIALQTAPPLILFSQLALAFAPEILLMTSICSIAEGIGYIPALKDNFFAQSISNVGKTTGRLAVMDLVVMLRLTTKVFSYGFDVAVLLKKLVSTAIESPVQKKFNYESPDFTWITQPLVNYIKSNNQQYCQMYTGNNKRKAVTECLSKIENNPVSTLYDLKESLLTLKQDSRIKGISGTVHAAIQESVNRVDSLLIGNEVKLIGWEPYVV